MHAQRMSARPVVVARTDGWSPADAPEEELAVIRAQLRGLGAELVVRDGARAWRFGPDDRVERARDPADASDARAPWLALFDEDGAERFRASLAPGADLAASLARALDAALRALAARPAAPLEVTRREWVTACLVAGFALAFGEGCGGKSARVSTTAASAPAGASDVQLTLDVNGAARPVRADARATLLDVLRERMGLTGTKKGCGMGQCGACTVLLDGRRANACLVFAVAAQGKRITTIEGLARGGELHPMQQAFIADDALQCGYCTPGQIMSAVALLAEGRATSDDEIREQMSGNICRCGAYPNIVRAIRRAQNGA